MLGSLNLLTILVDLIRLKNPSSASSDSIGRKFGEGLYGAIFSHWVVDWSHCHLIIELGESVVVLQLHGGIPTQIYGRTECQWDDQFYPFERILPRKV